MQVGQATYAENSSPVVQGGGENFAFLSSEEGRVYNYEHCVGVGLVCILCFSKGTFSRKEKAV